MSVMNAPRPAPRPALDIDRMRLGAEEAAALDQHPGDPARGLAADADARPVRVAKAAVGDVHVARRPGDPVAFLAPARLDRDAIVAGVEAAPLDHHSLAGIDIDPVRPAFDHHVAEAHVAAEDRVDRPHRILPGEDLADVDVPARDQLDQRRVAVAGGAVDPRVDRRIAEDTPLAGDAEMLGILGADQADMALHELAFPAHLAERIIGQVGRAEDRRALQHAQQRVRSDRDRAGQPGPRRHHHLASAEHRAAVERLLEGERVLAAIALRSEIAHIERDAAGGSTVTPGPCRRHRTRHAQPAGQLQHRTPFHALSSRYRCRA